MPESPIEDGHLQSHSFTSYLLEYHTKTHATIGVSPGKLFFQQYLRIRFDLLQPHYEKIILDRQSQQKFAHNICSSMQQWTVEEQLMVDNLCSGPDWVCGTISKDFGPAMYINAKIDDQQCKMIR